MFKHELSALPWRKSSHSDGNGGECLEVADLPIFAAFRQGFPGPLRERAVDAPSIRPHGRAGRRPVPIRAHRYPPRAEGDHRQQPEPHRIAQRLEDLAPPPPGPRPNRAVSRPEAAPRDTFAPGRTSGA
jgi:hypothetical protein